MLLGVGSALECDWPTRVLLPLSAAMKRQLLSPTSPRTPLPCWHFVCLELAQILCELSQPLWVPQSPCWPGTIAPSPLALAISLQPPLWSSLNLKGREWCDIIFRSEHSSVSMLIIVHCKKKLLWSMWRNALINGNSNKLLSLIV